MLEKVNMKPQVAALHDVLTGLPNRLLFSDRLAHALQRYRRDADQNFVVLSLDLNDFKSVNNGFGHAGGDALLVAVGQRLRKSLREADTVARLGGSEFTVLLEHRGAEYADEILNRIRGMFSQPFQVGEHRITVTASVGAVFSKTAHTTPEEVLRDADLAMYNAKLRKANHFMAHSCALSDSTTQPFSLEADLRLALEQQKLDLYFQPIIHVYNQNLTGFEVLVRWQHPTYGLLLPKAFIPLAEETSLIIELDRYVLSGACKQLAQWQTAFPDHTDLCLNVNFSGRQFAYPDLVLNVQNNLLQHRLNPRSLNLEITESFFTPSGEMVDTVVNQLAALGIGICIDDFGTGFASLDYLRRFPATILKIDRSFLAGMLRNDAGLNLVKAIIQLAHTLGLKVVAEGIEAAGQLYHLKELQCEFAQGYLFAEPLNKEQATAFITAARPNDGVW